MLESAIKWLANHSGVASLIAVGSFLYTAMRARHQYESRSPQSVIVWVLDFLVAAASGIIFAAGASALGLEGNQIMAIGGIGGYMGPRGMKTIGETLTSLIEAKAK